MKSHIRQTLNSLQVFYRFVINFIHVVAYCTLYFYINIGCASTVNKQERSSPDMVENTFIADSLIPDVDIYTIDPKTESNSYPLTEVQTQYESPIRILGKFVVNNESKSIVISLCGIGSFTWITQSVPGMSTQFDPIFHMTMPNNGKWRILKGILSGKNNNIKQGSWASIYKYLEYTNPSKQEYSIPLASLGLSPEGKITVMKFVDTTKTLILYVNR